jgi:hypothetical protein
MSLQGWMRWWTLPKRRSSQGGGLGRDNVLFQLEEIDYCQEDPPDSAEQVPACVVFLDFEKPGFWCCNPYI